MFLYENILKGYQKLFNDYPDIVTIYNLRQMLNIGRSTAYTLLQNNKIRHVRVGKKYIIPKNAVIGFVNNMCYDSDQIINDRLSRVMKGDYA